MYPRPAMQFQFDVASASNVTLPPVGPEAVPSLLQQMLDLQRDTFREILETQREHLTHARATSHDNLTRWRNLIGRWQKEFPEFGDQCKAAYPLMERAYVQLLSNLVLEIAEQGEEALENEFAVQEFLD